MNKLLNNEVDMLEGNINRMCVTSDLEELVRMYKFAKKRIDSIFEYKKYFLEMRNEK
ncbi:MAG: hypothetical protein ACTTIR_06020 [Eggerthia catenaformis]|uniref:hypothetical protein n=1 Tax=Eggerthia catenaformis TaxID=31973 RepID=UPI003F9FC3BB